jgi:CheY-like chemotaxis protein
MDDRSLLGDVPLGKLGGAKVLVVDDDEEIRVFLTTLFSDEGALVFEAEDGIQALEVATKKLPDIITLDLSMPGPGRDGIDTFCDLRENSATENIAVCIITGHPEFRKVIYPQLRARSPTGRPAGASLHRAAV